MNKQEIGYVYKITSPSHKIYIGSTKNINKRQEDYKYYTCKKQRKLYNSLVKYRWENHKFEVVWTGLISDMLKHETLIGLNFNVLSRENLNSKLPKLGDTYNCVSAETREKMSNSTKSRPYSQKAIDRMKEVNLGQHRSQEIRNKIRAGHIGKIISQEVKNKMGKGTIKTLFQYDLDNNFIRKFESVSEARRILHINIGNVCACCKKKRKTAHKYKWSYFKLDTND